MNEQPKSVAEPLGVDDLSLDDLQPLLAFYLDLAPQVVRAYRPYGWTITEQTLCDGPFSRQAAGDELAMILRDATGAIWGHAFLSDVLSETASFGIGVHQSLLGRGLGRRLMTALLDKAARECDLKEIKLICVQDNAAAVNLYTSLGFEQTDAFIEPGDGLPYFAMRKVTAP